MVKCPKTLKKLEKLKELKNGVIFLLMGILVNNSYAQETYNSCNSALEICPQTTFTLNNIGANKTFCGSCEDDFTFCFTPNNSIWLTFTTNAVGGNVQVDFTNLVFETNPGQDTELQATVLEAAIPCNSASYTQLGTCVTTAAGAFTLTIPGLLPNTVYYIVISGDNIGPGITSAAECTFDLVLSGVGVNRLAPLISIVSSSPICKGQPTSVSAYVSNCPDSIPFRWYLNGDLVAVTNVDYFLTSDLQDGDVVTVETNCYTICSIPMTISTSPINVVDFPIDAGPDQFINEGDIVQLNGQTTSNSYFWTPTFDVSNDTILNPFVNPNQTTIYTLTATDNGCTFYDYVTITVDNQLFFPNTFSPNGDGENDTWEVLGIENYPDCQLKIFSRWGQIVFESTGYSKAKAWNGEGKLGPLNESVYYYEIYLRDAEKRTLKGSITLIR